MALRAELAQVDAALRARTQAVEAIGRLMTMPWIGPLTAAMIAWKDGDSWRRGGGDEAIVTALTRNCFADAEGRGGVSGTQGGALCTIVEVATTLGPASRTSAIVIGAKRRRRRCPLRDLADRRPPDRLAAARRRDAGGRLRDRTRDGGNVLRRGADGSADGAARKPRAAVQ